MPVYNAKPIAELNKREVITFLIVGNLFSSLIITFAIIKGQYSYFNLFVLTFAGLWLATLWVRCLKRLAELKRHSENPRRPSPD
jgi:hypothetical protein